MLCTRARRDLASPCISVLWSRCVQEQGETWHVLDVLMMVALYTRAGRGLASPYVSMVLLVTLCSEARRPGKSLPLCRVVSHVICRGFEKPYCFVMLLVTLCTEARKGWRVFAVLWCCYSHFVYRCLWKSLTVLSCCWSRYVKEQGQAEQVFTSQRCCWSGYVQRHAEA